MPLYYYPNRPTLIPPDPKDPLNPKSDYINGLETSGKYVAEQKWNGDNCLIYTTGLEFWNRHKARLSYQPSPEAREEWERWPKDSIINAELIHNKSKTIKHLFIVHCIMQWKGELLIGKTWGDSRAILEECLATGLSGEQVRISKVWQSGFWDLFQAADVTTIEGIILKDPMGKLRYSTTPLADVSWMLKIRKPCKKYSF
jgi:hypothetical protein